ncbi:phosphoribosylaminoimidazolesuccinocarboxamide synthase, partial [Phascolarctobacterium succinatutens]|uniref:phosphoribosylaminoimidazolesuccinocarboxamide synthase n=2 Tax=Phascolarctobacterium succinatutens TaxID=626940 RepID=UPI003AF86911
MQEYKPFKSGKVREMYDVGDSIIMVATDRISAFDHILKNMIVKKGTVLTQISKFWFDLTKDIVPNHMISVDTKDMPEFFQKPEFTGNSMKCKKLNMLPIECIVRGYITGSGWESYKKTGEICGIKLPEGLQESQKLAEPIFTPSTKAEIGDHDENISVEQSIEILEKLYPGRGKEYALKLRDYTIAIYKKCAAYALERGIIIADTKFEFGLDENGEVVLGDEMITPDCSRFWPLEGYKVGQGQPSYDKQFVRDWLSANPDAGYELPQDVIDKTISPMGARLLKRWVVFPLKDEKPINERLDVVEYFFREPDFK